jgi:mono/diheme cytochrome c family protein
VPAPGDLERTIREGMAGTEMVPFKHLLSRRSIAEVATYIKGFSKELSDPEAKADDEELVKVPAQRPFPRSDATSEEGKSLFSDNDCTDCHGDEGEGSSDETDDWKLHVEMVPFQAGYYKSGRTDQDLFRTIATGMKGTTMDSYRDDLSDEEIWKLVDYIRSLDSKDKKGFLGSIVDYFFRSDPSGFDYSSY